MIIHDLFEEPQSCPECGGISFSDLILAEKKDACYYKVKASAKVWPSAYASGRLVQCRKKGAGNYGNKSEGVAEGLPQTLRKVVPGYAKREIDKKMDAGKFGKTDADKDANFQRYKKIQDKIKEQGVAEAGLDEAHHGSLLNPKKGQFASVIFQSQWDTDPQIDYYNNLDDAKFDTENASAHHGSVYAWNGARWVRKMSATERTGGGGGYGSWEENKQGVAEADDSNFVGFMNKTLADKVDSPKADPIAGAPDFYRNAAVSTLDARRGFKNALKFGLKALSRLDPETRQQLAAGSEQAVANYLTDVAERSGQMGDDTFVEEDISEVQDYLSDVFHDPSINSWKDVLQQSQGMSDGQLDEKSVSQAQFRTMAAAAHNPKFAKKVGISRDVAKEFHGADRKQDYTDLPKKADESKSAPKEKEADYGDDYQDMVARVKKLAGLGPLKTVYDPTKRVYRNMPTAQQPKK